MNRTRVAIGVVLFSILHFVASVIAFGIAFALGMNRFDSGADPTLPDTLAHSVAEILFFPGRQLALVANIHNDAAEWLVVFGNSLLWGLVMFGLFTITQSIGRQFFCQTRSRPEPE